MSAKQRKKNNLMNVEKQDNTQQVYNENLYAHLIACQSIPRPLMSNAESVQTAIAEYFNTCKQYGVKPAISSLGSVLGLSRKDVLDIANGHKKSENSDLVRQALQFIEQYDEIAMKDGKMPPIVAIFMAKNNYGYTDGVKVEVVKEELTNEEIAERYRQMHDIVAEVKDK